MLGGYRHLMTKHSMINERQAPSGVYYSTARLEVIRHLPPTIGRVLDIGCGAGDLLVELKRRGATSTTGIEIRTDVARLAASRLEIDSVLALDVERDEIPLGLHEFDLVIASHVLEHLNDPWSFTRRMSEWIAPGGSLIGAIPNVRHASVLVPLVFAGRWNYSDSGILDWTHLRFFTKSGIRRLLQDAALNVVALTPEIDGTKSRVIQLASLGLLDDLAAYAYSFVAIPAAERPVGEVKRGRATRS
jgi:2-polyprenyl-3-methyl-5-hydroxy-6-metoxy-1,4-benzoquinol methylase